MKANRTVTSREYKLMLQADRFRDRAQGAAAFWELVAFLVEKKQGGQILKTQDTEFQRETWYLDTPGAELRKHGYVLRVRKEHDENDQFEGFKVTLKYRDPDRYVSASRDVSCEFDGKKKKKFEEDILPPFASKFARSVAFEVEDEPVLATVAQVTGLYPGLEALAIPANTPIRKVHGFTAQEVARYAGQLHFAGTPVPEDDEADFVVKCCMTFWYLQKGDEWPLAAEFSFDYDLPKDEAKDSGSLEHFAPQVVAGTNRLFHSLQKQAGWLDSSGTTKTAYAFDAL